MKDLTEFENAVLSKLLEGDHPVLKNLRQQAQFARLASRDLTGVGFYCDYGDSSLN